ncbi:MAG TPA: hypothetical protein VH080_08345, partial [Gemmatimonadaceae bacterium]|nr:hypothetical protein [Gemmatimonadaceae bacterium]
RHSTHAAPPAVSRLSNRDHIAWAANHKMVPVTVTVSAHDNCDPNPICAIGSITSNEPPNGGGSGNTSPDFQITGPLTANLRAERDGTAQTQGRFVADR